MTPELLIWLSTSIVGLLLAIRGVLEATRDLRALRAVTPRNGRWMVARQQLIRYALRIGMSGSFALAAIVGDVRLIVWLLIAGNIGLSLTTASDLVTGAFLRRSIRRQLEATTDGRSTD